MHTPSQGKRLNWQLRRLEMMRRVIGDGITTQAGLQRGRLPVLDYVRFHEGCSQREIADFLHVTPASITVTVRRMEQDGLLTRTPDAQDQRVMRIHATPLGQKKAEACREAFGRVDALMLRGLSDEEIEHLRATLEKLFDNLSEGQDFPFFYQE